MRPLSASWLCCVAALASSAHALCPAELRASVQATGLLPVDYFRALAPNGTCDDAVRQAINASHGGCGRKVETCSAHGAPCRARM